MVIISSRDYSHEPFSPRRTCTNILSSSVFTFSNKILHNYRFQSVRKVRKQAREATQIKSAATNVLIFHKIQESCRTTLSRSSIFRLHGRLGIASYPTAEHVRLEFQRLPQLFSARRRHTDDARKIFEKDRPTRSGTSLLPPRDIGDTHPPFFV